MSWLRIDDQMIVNPKIGTLTDIEFRALLALWGYCARRKSGDFHEGELRYAFWASPEGPQSVSRAHLKKLQRAGLIERRGTRGRAWRVRDWAHYQPKDPTAAERAKRYRDRNADRDENVTSRARDPVPSRPIESSPSLTEVHNAGQRGNGWVENLSSYTGCRYVRGSHALTAVYDPLGTERPPSDWPHDRPTKKEIQKALHERAKEAASA